MMAQVGVCATPICAHQSERSTGRSHFQRAFGRKKLRHARTMRKKGKLTRKGLWLIDYGGTKEFLNRKKGNPMKKSLVKKYYGGTKEFYNRKIMKKFA